jgi:hypothetical protein
MEASVDKSDAHDFWKRVRSTVSIAKPATHRAISVVSSTTRMSLPRIVLRTPTKLGSGVKKRVARLKIEYSSGRHRVLKRDTFCLMRHARSAGTEYRVYLVQWAAPEEGLACAPLHADRDSKQF